MKTVLTLLMFITFILLLLVATQWLAGSGWPRAWALIALMWLGGVWLSLRLLDGFPLLSSGTTGE